MIIPFPVPSPDPDRHAEKDGGGINGGPAAPFLIVRDEQPPSDSRRVLPSSMQSQLLEEASKLFPDTQKLINMVSRRVRQLSHGATPLVDPGARIIWSDIALREIIAGKLQFRESTPVSKNGGTPPAGGGQDTLPHAGSS